MKILITGPSCSGKTRYLHSLLPVRAVQLDLHESPEEILALAGGPGALLFEGLPSGSDRQMKDFLCQMDLVLVLDTPFSVRLRRMIERDGPEALGRFLFNEHAWHRYVMPLFQDHPDVRCVGEADLPRDPFALAV